MITANINITEIDGQLIMTLKRKPNWFILPLTGIYALGWIGMLGVIIYGLVTDPEKLDGEIILFTTLFFIAGLFILKIFLWHLRGHEKITVDRKELRIDRLGTILTIPRKYEIDQIETITNTENPTTPRWMVFWGLAGGQIEFVYLGQTKYFGQTLTATEATKIIEKLKDKIIITTH
jgi:hypothetical protein